MSETIRGTRYDAPAHQRTASHRIQHLKADEHWPTDVLVGLLVGFASGWFDLPNAAAFLHKPLGVEWLKENTRVENARVMPTVAGGALGLRLDLQY